jgi:hypothetical protein
MFLERLTTQNVSKRQFVRNVWQYLSSKDGV